MIEVNTAHIVAFIAAIASLISILVSATALARMYADSKVREDRQNNLLQWQTGINMEIADFGAMRSELSGLQAWRAEHVDTSHKSLGLLNEKVDKLAEGVNRLIGEVRYSNGKDK